MSAGDALDKARKCVQANPGDATAWLDYVQALIARDLRPLARQVGQQALIHRFGLSFQHQLNRLLGDAGEATFEVTLDAILQDGLAQHAARRFPEAQAAFQAVLDRDRDHVPALCGLGNVLFELGQLAPAIGHYQRAVGLRPNWVAGHERVGDLCVQMGQYALGVESFQRAIGLSPRSGVAWLGLGIAQTGLRHLDAARTSCAHALALASGPTLAAAHAQLGVIADQLGDLLGFQHHYSEARRLAPTNAALFSTCLFNVAYRGQGSTTEYLAQSMQWEQYVIASDVRAEAASRQFGVTARAGRRLRVGYMSGDLREQAVVYFFKCLLNAHDRASIEISIYSTNPQRDSQTQSLQALCEHWLDLGSADDDTVRRRIAADKIDVLIDLSGHTAYNRLGVFAARAAPVQAHYLGYFASTGLSQMDYWIGDDVLTPQASDVHFKEAVYRLPRVWLCYEGRDDAPAVAWQASPNGALCLGSFNNLSKINSATLALWAAALKALPGATLLLKTPALDDASNRARIEATMAALGIPSQRLTLVGSTLGWAEHMDAYNLVDIALDPIEGVGGGTTTCDALWMGVPVVTLRGEPMAQRMTASMLSALERSEWIADTPARYLDIVYALAQDASSRRAARATQRERMRGSPLCDAQGLARALEAAYADMFDRYRDSSGAENLENLENTFPTCVTLGAP